MHNHSNPSYTLHSNPLYTLHSNQFYLKYKPPSAEALGGNNRNTKWNQSSLDNTFVMQSVIKSLWHFINMLTVTPCIAVRLYSPEAMNDNFQLNPGIPGQDFQTEKYKIYFCLRLRRLLKWEKEEKVSYGCNAPLLFIVLSRWYQLCSTNVIILSNWRNNWVNSFFSSILSWHIYVLVFKLVWDKKNIFVLDPRNLIE